MRIKSDKRRQQFSIKADLVKYCINFVDLCKIHTILTLCYQGLTDPALFFKLESFQ